MNSRPKPHSSKDQFIPDSHSDLDCFSADRSSEPGQIMNRFFNDERITSLAFDNDNIEPLDSDRREDIGQSPNRHASSQTSQSSLTCSQASSPPSSSQGTNAQQPPLEESCNQPPIFSDTSERAANTDPQQSGNTQSINSFVQPRKAPNKKRNQTKRNQTERDGPKLRERQLPTPWTGYITATPETTTQNKVRQRPSGRPSRAASQNFQQHGQTASSWRAPAPDYIPEPALHSKTYQLPKRSEATAFLSKLTASFSSVVVLFLIGIALVLAIGAAFPYEAYWLAISGPIYALVRVLFVAVAFLVAATFVLEFR